MLMVFLLDFLLLQTSKSSSGNFHIFQLYFKVLMPLMRKPRFRNPSLRISESGPISMFNNW